MTKRHRETHEFGQLRHVVTFLALIGLNAATQTWAFPYAPLLEFVSVSLMVVCGVRLMMLANDNPHYRELWRTAVGFYLAAIGVTTHLWESNESLALLYGTVLSFAGGALCMKYRRNCRHNITHALVYEPCENSNVPTVTGRSVLIAEKHTDVAGKRRNFLTIECCYCPVTLFYVYFDQVDDLSDHYRSYYDNALEGDRLSMHIHELLPESFSPLCV